MGRLPDIDFDLPQEPETNSIWPDEGEDWNIEPYEHPPQNFRDKANGE